MRGPALDAAPIARGSPWLVRDCNDVAIFTDARDPIARHVLNAVAHPGQHPEEAGTGRPGFCPREWMHFHQDRPGTPALFRQDISRTLDFLLLETFDVNFDHVDSIAGKRVVQRSHRHCDHTVACVWAR